jgi:hypothetical protein
MPTLNTSWGDLCDRLTILDLKRAHARTDADRAAVDAQRAPLQAAVDALFQSSLLSPGTAAELARHLDALRAANAVLWDLEDQIREKQRAWVGTDPASPSPPPPDLVAVALAIPRANDARHALKCAIDRLAHADEPHRREVKIYAAAASPV